MLVFPAKAGTQRSVDWTPAFARVTDWVPGQLRDTSLDDFPHPPMFVFPAKAGIQRSVGWTPAFARVTDWESCRLRDTELAPSATFAFGVPSSARVIPARAPPPFA
jgi:hypothetical protein